MKFNPVDPTKSLQQLEEETVQYWKDNKTFEKSIEQRPTDNSFAFVDGPPFVTGSPHYGSLLPSIAKDVIPRYQTMKSKRVRRVWGWDCHGLPIEEKVNKLFGIRSSTELERKMGVEKYVQECRKYVETASSDWRWYIDRIGRWVDMDNAYYTMSPTFMESVIHAFKKIHDQGLIYKGKRVSLYSTDTSTPVSGFEVAMDTDNYRDVEDLSIFAKFKLLNVPSEVSTDSRPIYLVAWTTTPWTIPANFALAVNEKFDYVLVEYENELLIVAKDRLLYTFNEDEAHVGPEADKIVRILKQFKGTELHGLTYEPIYNFFAENKKPNDFKVYLSDDVTIEDGTGVLHIAPAFGEVDFSMGKKHDLSDLSDINEEGLMNVGPWTGTYLRDASPLVAEDMQQKGSLLRSETYKHRLPFYRGKNPLIYIAQDAYFINIQKIKDRMAQLNEKTNWIPDHIKNGRFLNTIQTAPDWCISRNRYWATIMPIWKNDNGDEIVVGSIEELASLTDQIEKRTENGKTVYYFENKPMDLHRDVCDKIVLKKNGQDYHRIPEVLDCWMDSGSAPFAEFHYPFENKEIFEKTMPADFIIEYVGQVRAWFNVLLRLSTLMFDESAFTNVICTGVLAGTDGRKMSKSFGNYPDPKTTIEKYGADAFRLYMMSSPVMLGEDMNFSENDLSDQVKSILNILWNSHKYFITYATATNFVPGHTDDFKDTLLDTWIKVRLQETKYIIISSLDEYNIPVATRAIRPFVDDLSTWYIRRSRNRFAVGDTQALQTLHDVLLEFAKITAPIIPFIAENIYRGLTDNESVHLELLTPSQQLTDEQKKLLENMQLVRDISSLGQAARLQAKMPIKQPLQTAQIQFVSQTESKDTNTQTELPDEFLSIIAEELNVKVVVPVDTLDNSYVAAEDKGIKVGLDTTLNEDLQVEGKLRELTRALQEARKQKGLQVSDSINLKWYTDEALVRKAMIAGQEQLKATLKVNVFTEVKTSDELVKLDKENIFIEISK